MSNLKEYLIEFENALTVIDEGKDMYERRAAFSNAVEAAEKIATIAIELEAAQAVQANRDPAISVDVWKMRQTLGTLWAIQGVETFCLSRRTQH